MSAEWWRSYRARNRERINRQQAVRRQRNGRGDRTLERQRERERRRCVPAEPLPMLMPHLQHGVAVAFWEDELRLDLAQEMELAKLEGRCPVAAVKAYRSREYAWYRRISMQSQVIDDINGDEIAS